jgi:enoyl-CoA hydratase/carnithine racemase
VCHVVEVIYPFTKLPNYQIMNDASSFYIVSYEQHCAILELVSHDDTNKLGSACVRSLTVAVEGLSAGAERGVIKALIITGNRHFFSAGADLNEIAHLTGPAAFEFSRMGQRLTRALQNFPVPAIAAIQGYCMGGGMDLALACHFRIAAPNAIFGHRGAALGLITGWGGTQRLPRLIGRARALQMFLLAEKVPAERAYEIGLVNMLSDDPLAQAVQFFK